MPKHKGYEIVRIVEMTTRGKDCEDEESVSYNVELDEKVIAVGLPTSEAAKAMIERRHRMRNRRGLDPVG